MPRLSLLLLALAALPACSSTPEPVASHGSTADEQLLFALPHWCSWSERRQPWTTWQAAQQASFSGTGVCGVQLPLSEIDAKQAAHKPEDGLCVEYRQGYPVRVELRRGGKPEILEVERQGASGVIKAKTTPDLQVDYRVLGPSVEASLHGGQAAQGPCFWRSSRE